MSVADFQLISVLVVDDNSYMRRIVRTMLGGFGMRIVFEAETVDDAIALAGRDMPDIVLTDWYMPNRDGSELVRFLRNEKNSPNPYVPIILLTAYTEKQHVLKAAELGVNEILCKPISATALYRRIYNVLYKPRPFIRTKTYFGPEPRHAPATLLRPTDTVDGDDGTFDADTSDGRRHQPPGKHVLI